MNILHTSDSVAGAKAAMQEFILRFPKGTPMRISYSSRIVEFGELRFYFRTPSSQMQGLRFDYSMTEHPPRL